MSEVVVCALDLIASTIPDSPKDVKGHDAQEGDTEELDVVRDPAAADGQATGQPVTVVDLGEKRLGSKLPEKSDIPNSPYSASTLVKLIVKKVRPKLLNESGITKKFKTKLCD